MLCFMVVAFYYGVKCIGGFNQVNYLTFLKNAYIKMQTDRGDYRSIEVCVRSQTKELCDGLTVVFLEDPKKNMVLATGPDLILHADEATWPNFIIFIDKQEYRAWWHTSSTMTRIVNDTISLCPPLTIMNGISPPMPSSGI
jgi:hypothetical protein